MENGLYSGVLEGEGKAVGDWLAQPDFEQRLLDFFPALKETSLAALQVRQPSCSRKHPALCAASRPALLHLPLAVK